ncbi:hypothetical protein [Baaleninema sp.]|uniref:hypothetical protein n=1 Tax=Baaleninema sp. TaxID=3101197 RepID=UPI003D00C55F
MSDSSSIDPEEIRTWQAKIQQANRNNLLCHCQVCDREWVSSRPEPCSCGSRQVESIACWQFPDG